MEIEVLPGGNRIKFFNSRFQSWKKNILLLKQKLCNVLSQLSFKAHSKSLGIHAVTSLTDLTMKLALARSS